MIRLPSLSVATIVLIPLAIAGTMRADATFPLLDGSQQAVIVGNGRLLQQGVERCTGITLPIVSEAAYKPVDDRFPIFVGDTETARRLLAEDIARLDVEGYILLVQPRQAVIYAPRPTTDTGDPLNWAQADFLRKFMGVRWLMPGELGMHFPAQVCVRIAAGKWVEQPAFKHRHWSGYCGSPGPVWRVRASGGGGRFKDHHNLFRVFDPARFGDDPTLFPVIIPDGSDATPRNPHYRGLKPGERFVPPAGLVAYWQPCTTHPRAIDIVVNAVAEQIRKHPDDRTFSLGINDSGGFCLCERCLAVSPPGVDPGSDAANGYRFYRFYNAVAERVAAELGDVRLGFLVYSDLTDWHPTRLHPLLMPYLTMSMADRWDPAFAARQNELIERWSHTASQFGIYEWLFGKGYFIPRIYLGDFADGLRQAAKCGAEGFYAEAYANWGLDGPKLYVTERLLWNPSEDVDALLDEWHTAMFGDAGPAMRSYFDRLEQAWCQQQPSDERRGGYRIYSPTNKAAQFSEVFTPSVCDEAWLLLEQAETHATADLARRRIEMFKASFAATRAASHRFAAAEALDASFGNRADQPPLADLIATLDGWARHEAINPYMQNLSRQYPLAFQEFCEGKPFSFAAWDTQPSAIHGLAVRTVDEALKATGGVTREKQLDDATSRLLDQYAQYPAAVSLLRRHAQGMTMTMRDLDAEPQLDGIVEPLWGEPSFDGPFYLYPHEDEPAEENTKVWLRRFGDKLCIAIRSEQPRDSIDMSQTDKHDDIVLNDRGTVQPGDGGRDFPYLRAGDSVGVALPGQLYATVIVTPRGGVFDAHGSAYGYRTEWDGASVAVHLDDAGWTVEMIVAPYEPEAVLFDKPTVVRGFNFFRMHAGRRSAWTPAAPRLWSIHPRTSGYVVYESP